MDKFWEHFDRIVDFLLLLAPIVWWIARWMRRLDISMGFTKTVAKEHLPHVYSRLRRVDDALELPVEEHPDIVYINGNGGVRSQATK